jgi:hypothetical protein
MTKTSVFFRIFPMLLGATLSIVVLTEVSNLTQDSTTERTALTRQ